MTSGAYEASRGEDGLFDCENSSVLTLDLRQSHNTPTTFTSLAFFLRLDSSWHCRGRRGFEIDHIGVVECSRSSRERCKKVSKRKHVL